MDTPPTTSQYKNHRFPAEIISHAVWLYFRFCLSYRDVEELLFEHDVVVTYEAIRQWCHKFRQQHANQLRHRRPRPGDKRHLDEVFLTIKGKRHYLWRAAEQEGQVLDILVQRRLKGLTYVPRVLITDKLQARMTKLPNQRTGDNIGKNLPGISPALTPAFQGKDI